MNQETREVGDETKTTILRQDQSLGIDLRDTPYRNKFDRNGKLESAAIVAESRSQRSEARSSEFKL